MRTTHRFVVLPALLAALALLMAACTGGASPSAPESQAASVPASAAESMAASEEPEACAPDTLETKQDGVLTIGTDNPAYPPYFDPPADDEEAPEPWDEGLGDPTNGRGFESAVAYAVAGQLGFGEDQVEWIAVPFDNSYAPGEKEFDFYLAQVSYTDERAQAVDMSEGYYFANQALVANADSDITDAASIEDLQSYTLGAAQGTTSYTYIVDEIQPDTDPMVYNTNDAAIAALEAEQVHGIVVDLPTAYFITAAQMDSGVVVGQFPPAGGADEDQEHFSLVMELDSPLTDCVNEAIAALWDSGDLDDITTEWMSEATEVPVLE
jgi:polar amino acid transport system substrate-binding protein